MAKKSPPSPVWVLPTIVIMLFLLGLLAFIAFYLGDTYAEQYSGVLASLGTLIAILGIPSEIASSDDNRWRFLGATATGAVGCAVSYILMTFRFLDERFVKLSYFVGLLAIGFFIVAFLYIWINERREYQK